MIDLNTQDSIKLMLKSISVRRGGIVSKSTKVTFFVYIKQFCEFCGMTPDELMKERRIQWKSDDMQVQRKHEEKLMDFAIHLREKGRTSNTASTAVGAVRSLYRCNYMPIIELKFPAGRSVRKYKIPSKEELAQVVGMAHIPWHKAFMVLTKDCGISLQDMLALKLGDGSAIYGTITQQLKKGQVPIHINIIREKTQFAYDTFLGEDSVEVLNNDYPRARMSGGMSGGEKRLFPYAPQTIQDSMNALKKKMGWEDTFSPYSLRKWFRTQLTLDDMNDSLIETMMGHSLTRVKAAYFIPPPQKLIEKYEEHYPALKL